MALSDDFSSGKLGPQWSFHGADADEAKRVRFEDRSLVLRGKGNALADCSPLCLIVGDRSYEATVVLDVSGEAHGGLALFYDERGHAGLGFSSSQMLTYGYGQEQSWMREPIAPGSIHLRLTNRQNVLSFQHSRDGQSWTQHPWQMEVSGFHHNVFGGFLSLRLALFCAGKGSLRARNFTYRGLPA